MTAIVIIGLIVVLIGFAAFFGSGSKPATSGSSDSSEE